MLVLTRPSQAQTPAQRRANEAYAKSEASKRGKSAEHSSRVAKKDKQQQKPPISTTWVYLLLFVVCGGVVVELLRIIFGASRGWFN